MMRTNVRPRLRIGSMLLGFMLTATAWSQAPGTLRLLIDPGHDFVFVVDGKHRLQQREITLPGGPHRFQFWAPARRIVDTILPVFPDRTVDFALRLPYSDEYKTFQLRMKDYSSNRRLYRALPMALTGASAVVSAALFGSYKKKHDVLVEDVATYHQLNTPGGITNLKDNTMAEHQDEFKKAKTAFVISASLTGALAATTVYLYMKSAKWELPVFEDKERVRFEGLTWVPSGNGGFWYGGLAINLVRS